MKPLETYRQGKVSVVLEEDGDRGAEINEAECADVVAVEEDLVCGRVVESHDDLENGALARAIGADYDTELPGEEFEGDVLEGVLVQARVLEQDAPED